MTSTTQFGFLDFLEFSFILWCLGTPAVTPDFHVPEHFFLAAFHALQLILMHTDEPVRAWWNGFVIFLDLVVVAFQAVCYFGVIPCDHFDSPTGSLWREAYKFSLLVFAVVLSVWRYCNRVDEDAAKEKHAIKLRASYISPSPYPRPPPMAPSYHHPPPPPPQPRIHYHSAPPPQHTYYQHPHQHYAYQAVVYQTEGGE
jgi:hypothetical protein